MMVGTIGICFLIEVFLAKPDWGGIAAGFVPHMNTSAVYIIIGMLGATVMPHNLYLHSSLVQSRAVSNTFTGKSQACRFNLIDSAIALNAAFFVNAAILVMAAADFHSRGILVTEIQQAHQLLNTLLGATIAPVAFAIALIASGQSSTITGTISGQVVMEGFLNLRIRPWLRRLITRAIALIPAVIVIAIAGNEGTYQLLILSQVVLSLQLPFATIPLIHFTSDRRKMGAFASGFWVKALSWITAAIIVALNLKLVYDELGGWLSGGAWWAGLITAPIIGACLIVLVYISVRPYFKKGPEWESGLRTESSAVASHIKPMAIKHIGVALEHTEGDAEVVSAAVTMAKSHKGRLTLLHIVETPGTMVYGNESDSLHGSEDKVYLEELAREVEERDLPVEVMLGYGKPIEGIIRATQEGGFDMLVMGSHGHRAIGDLIHGQTVNSVRHAIDIPLMVIRTSHGTERAIRNEA